MLQKKIESALNKQIEVEGNSSQVYLAMASWAEVNGLNGVAKFLYSHSEEERQHMLKLIGYVNERGGKAEVPALKKPTKAFKSVRAVFQQILDHERKVSQQINEIVDLTLSCKDFITHNFMQWYVAEQIEEESLAQNMIDKLNLINEDTSGLYLFDRDLEDGHPGHGEEKA
ncbi:MAG: ferritin [Flavobacteriales bacterium]|nr:ferritin [Flavobacteriales bacterium]